MYAIHGLRFASSRTSAFSRTFVCLSKPWGRAVDTTSLYDLDEAQTKALVAGTPSQLGTNVTLWIQDAPNGSGTPIQAQILAKLKNDKDALHSELANLKAEMIGTSACVRY